MGSLAWSLCNNRHPGCVCNGGFMQQKQIHDPWIDNGCRGGSCSCGANDLGILPPRHGHDDVSPNLHVERVGILAHFNRSRVKRWLSSLPRPGYPLTGEFVLGSLLIGWGIEVLLYPGRHLTRIHAWDWLWADGEVRCVAIGSVMLGVFQILFIYKNWRIYGKFAAGASMALWLQFAIKMQYAEPGVHHPGPGVFLAAAFCSLWVVLTEERG
jgi:hypothetical protein